MPTTVSVTYFDTAMALIEIGPFRLLTDPVFDDSGAKFEYGPIRLEKTSKRSVQPEELGRIDAVLLTHDQHGDNLDDCGREFLKSVPLVLTTPLASTRLDVVHAVGLANWESYTLTGESGNSLTVTGMPSQHGPEGTEEMTGPTVGFLIESPIGDFEKIYFAGDTKPFSGTQEVIVRQAPVGLLLVNIGRVKLAPAGEMEFTMSAFEAVEFADQLQAKHVIPMHFEGWQHFSESLSEARSVFDQSKVADRTHWLESGKRITLDL
jgi:L-ascorbate metabolism protein UlaG (beta-lactamase superfamily)